MSASTPKRDYYEVLGVARDANDAVIKKSFRALARELHPDVNRDDPNAEEKFKEAAEAYEVLSDSERRATYDRYGHDGLRSGGYAPNFDGFGSMSDLFSTFFGGGGGLGDLFGGGFGGATTGPAQGADVQTTTVVSLADAATGVAVKLKYDAVKLCEHCHGNGAEPGTPIETCSTCGGAGSVRRLTRTPFGQVVSQSVCDACGGDGKIAKEPCRTCHGHGREVTHQTLSVDVPAGIADGQRIRVGGHGHAGERGGPPGDLYVLVRVREDKRFVRDGDDLVTTVDVSAPLAALGAEVDVETLGDPVPLEIPAGTQPGEILILKGLGMPALRGRRHGDLRVVVNVVVPKRLNGHQKKLLQEFADTLTEEHLRTDEGMLGKLRRHLGG